MPASLRILLLTHGTPFPVRSGGQMYTANVIQNLTSREDIDLTVIAVRTDDAAPQPPSGATWHMFRPPRDRGTIRGLLGRYPRSVAATMSRGYRDTVRRLLQEATWDAVIIDYIAIGWALNDVRRLCTAPDTQIVYLSHNVETTLRMRIAKGYTGPAPLRWLAIRDARKAGRLEAEIVRSSTLVTAETHEDAGEFRNLFHHKRIHLFSPGYDGHISESRAVSLSDSHRTVAVIGSRNATMKRLVLDELLQVTATNLAKSKVGIVVAGDCPKDYLTAKAAEYPGVQFHGFVEDIASLLSTVRLGVITDPIGGGFKHRVLTLVFNRVPIVATRDAMAGLPLTPDVHYVEVSGNEEVCGRVSDVIDDIALLNSMQDRAFYACREDFDWSASTDSFVAALNAAPAGRL